MIKFLCHAECNKPSNMMIWGIAPGTFRDEVTHDNCMDTCAKRHARWQAGRSTIKHKVLSVQPYLRLLYEECRELYVTGTPIYDAHMKENFQLRVLVADVICDFVGSFS